MYCRLQLKDNTKRSNGEIMYMSFKMIDTSNSMSGWNWLFSYYYGSLPVTHITTAQTPPIPLGGLCSYTHTVFNLYKEIGWLKLEDRRKYQKRVLTFKIRNNMVPDYLSTLFPRQVRESVQYNLRNQNDFVIPTRRTTLFERSFVPFAIQQWNSLPLTVRNIQSLSLFKCEF